MKPDYRRQIWVLALPLLLENTLQTLLGTVDRFFASSFRDSAIAAIGVTEIIMNLYLAVFMAINVGVSVLLGNYIGKNDLKQANTVAMQGVCLSLFWGIFLGLVSLLFPRQLLTVIGCTEEIYPDAVLYFQAVAVPSVFYSLSLTLSACLRASKDTKTPMYFSCFCNIFNILLNILFMNLGLGIFGIGIATSISRFFLSLGLFLTLRGKKEGISLTLGKEMWGFPHGKELLAISLPACGEKLVMRTGQILYTAMILSLGTEAYVAHTITATLENYIYIPVFALATTTSVLVSISFGEGNREKAYTYVSMINKLNLRILLGFSLFYVIFGKPWIGLFTDDPVLMETTYELVLLLAVAVPFMGILNLYTAALQGGGDTKSPMVATMFGIWVIRLGLGCVFVQVLEMDIFGIWCVIVMDCVIRATYLYCIYRKRYKVIEETGSFHRDSL